MNLKAIADCGARSAPIAFAFDSKSKPGTIIVHSIRFETLHIPAGDFDAINFKMLHPANDPRIPTLRECFLIFET